MKKKDTNLGEEYYKIVTENPESEMTWDDFFDKFKIPKESRTDFAVGAILNYYKKIIDEKEVAEFLKVLKKKDK